MTGLAKLGIALKSRAWQEAGAQGLTPTQGQLLALLRLRQRRRVSDLAEELGITAATASDAIGALVAKGLVAKVRSSQDGRAHLVELTPAGAREADRVAGWPDFLLDAVDALSPAEQAALLRALLKMIRVLQERRQIPVARMCVSCRFFRPNVHPDPERPHHCAFVDAPFGDQQLRLECPDQEPAPAEQAERLWTAFSGSAALPEVR
jgi:DNA-binding MarR family transcriptional regulator